MKTNLHFVVPKSKFTLLKGAENITTYTFNTHQAKHMFCKICGVQSFYVPRSNPDGYGKWYLKTKIAILIVRFYIDLIIKFLLNSLIPYFCNIVFFQVEGYGYYTFLQFQYYVLLLLNGYDFKLPFKLSNGKASVREL